MADFMSLLPSFSVCMPQHVTVAPCTTSLLVHPMYAYMHAPVPVQTPDRMTTAEWESFIAEDGRKEGLLELQALNDADTLRLISTLVVTPEVAAVEPAEGAASGATASAAPAQSVLLPASADKAARKKVLRVFSCSWWWQCVIVK